MSIVHIGLDELDSILTSDEIKEMEEVEKRTIMFDEESPEMTKEMLQQFQRADIL